VRVFYIDRTWLLDVFAGMLGEIDKEEFFLWQEQADFSKKTR
jgi:hypothetical protein